MPNAKKAPKKKPITRADRDTPEAAAEENSQPYDEIGKTDEEIRRASVSAEAASKTPNPT